MRAAIRIVLLAPAFALATAVVGWWAVPLLGVAWGVVVPRERPAGTAAAAAGLGWGLLLMWAAARGPAWEVARVVGPVVMLPGWLFGAVTLLFPAILAASAAEIGAAVRTRAIGKPGGAET